MKPLEPATVDEIRAARERIRAVAAALDGQAGGGKVVCVVSGGNVDPGKLAAILEGRMP